jgi:hypothetical protein
MAFAQRWTLCERGRQQDPIEWTGFKYFQIVAYQGGGGRNETMYQFNKFTPATMNNKGVYPQGDTKGVEAALKDAKRGIPSPSNKYVDNVVFYTEFTGQTVTLVISKDMNWVGKEGKNLIEIQPFSLIGINDGVLTVYRGGFKWDNQFRASAEMDDTFNFLAATYNGDPKLEKKIADDLKNKKTPEATARDASKWILARASGVAFLEGMGGLFVLPLSNLTKVTQWIYQSQIAYAVLLAYGRNKTPEGKNRTQADFKRDLIFLMGDDKTAIASIGKPVGAITFDVVLGIGSNVSQDKVAEKVFAKITSDNKLQKVGGAALAVVGGAYEGGKKLKENTAFLDRCIKFYKK